MATAIHREHFLVTMLKKEISTAKELDLRPLGKVIIFRVKQNLPIIYRLRATRVRNYLVKQIVDNKGEKLPCKTDFGQQG